jgi:hypothetical protein
MASNKYTDEEHDQFAQEFHRDFDHALAFVAEQDIPTQVILEVGRPSDGEIVKLRIIIIPDEVRGHRWARLSDSTPEGHSEHSPEA